MKRWCLLLLLVILSTSVSAIGISPDKLNLNYEPLAEGELSVYVINTEDSEINTSLTLQGDLAKYFKINEKYFYILTRNPFSIRF